jgi:hypothetical protein
VHADGAMVRRPTLLACVALAALACGASGGTDDGGAGPDGSLPAGGADSAPEEPGSAEISVAADAAWTDSELSIDGGELVRVRASGTISFDGESEVGPDGFGPDDNDGDNVIGCVDHAALIARVDAGGGAFLVGSEELLLAPRDGSLAFGPNDTSTSDNTGAFTVTVDRAQPVEILENRSVTVAGSATWVDTGIDVIPDHVIAIDADGLVDNNIPGGEVGPEGLADTANDPYNFLDCANHMSLIGKVGEGGDPFVVGRDRSLRAPASGRLFLRVNHSVPGGNTGKFGAAVLVAAPG